MSNNPNSPHLEGGRSRHLPRVGRRGKGADGAGGDARRRDELDHRDIHLLVLYFYVPGRALPNSLLLRGRRQTPTARCCGGRGENTRQSRAPTGVRRKDAKLKLGAISPYILGKGEENTTCQSIAFRTNIYCFLGGLLRCASHIDIRTWSQSGEHISSRYPNRFRADHHDKAVGRASSWISIRFIWTECGDTHRYSCGNCVRAFTAAALLSHSGERVGHPRVKLEQKRSRRLGLVDRASAEAVRVHSAGRRWWARGGAAPPPLRPAAIGAAAHPVPTPPPPGSHRPTKRGETSMGMDR